MRKGIILYQSKYGATKQYALCYRKKQGLTVRKFGTHRFIRSKIMRP